MQAGVCSNITNLKLGSNQLADHSVGPLMVEVLRSDACTITSLDLSDNQISGTVPTELMQLGGLEELVLSNIAPLEGRPGYSSATPLPMSGTIPTQLAALEGLLLLGLQDSSLSGTLPSQLASLSSLRAFYTLATALSGTLPPQLTELPLLTNLELDHTFCSGTVPSQLAELTMLALLQVLATAACCAILPFASVFEPPLAARARLPHATIVEPPPQQLRVTRRVMETEEVSSRREGSSDSLGGT